MALNLQPYNYKIFKPNYYSFITESGDLYECYFYSIPEYFPNYPSIASDFFGFNLDLISKPSKNKGLDKRIADTIIMIVGDFLSSRINAVVYVCDPSDGKGAVRARKFKSWFSYYEHSSHQILQLNTDIEVGGVKLYTALLVHKKNTLRKQFIDAYLELIDYDVDDK